MPAYPLATAIFQTCLWPILFACLSAAAWVALTPAYTTVPVLTPEVRKINRLAVLTTGFVLLQLVVGAVYHHTGKGLHLHFLGAFLVVVHGVLILKRAWTSAGTPPVIQRWAGVLNAFIGIQLILGFFTWRMPQPGMITAHQSVGALLLASALIMTVQSKRQKASA